MSDLIMMCMQPAMLQEDAEQTYAEESGAKIESSSVWKEEGEEEESNDGSDSSSSSSEGEEELSSYDKAKMRIRVCCNV